jgi:hypothetical protein
MTKITNSQQILDQFVGWFANDHTVSAPDINKPTAVIVSDGTVLIENLHIPIPDINKPTTVIVSDGTVLIENLHILNPQGF